MFEECCRKTGIIKIPTGEYSDSVPVFEDHTVSYFTMTELFRNADGIQQSADNVYCKGYEQPVPVEAKFIDEDGNEYDLTATKYIFNHFDNVFEFNKLTVAKHG